MKTSMLSAKGNLKLIVFKNEKETFHFQVVKRLHTRMQILLIRAWSDSYLGLLVVADNEKGIISFGQLVNNIT